MTPDEALAYLRKAAYRWAESSKSAEQEGRRTIKIEAATAVLERELRTR